MYVGDVKGVPVLTMRAKNQTKRRVRGLKIKFGKMMKCIFLGKQVREDNIVESSVSSLATRDHSASGYSARVGEDEKNTKNSTIEEAESTLRESGYLNYEEARALLGRLEYQKGNMEAAFHVFEGIDIGSITPNIKISLAKRCESQRRRSQGDDVCPMSMHAVSLLFEAIFLKAKSLLALGRFQEAAKTCQVILDTIESAIPEGLNERFCTYHKLHETLNNAVALLPELWKLSGAFHEAVSSYRRALLYNWNLELKTRTKVEKDFAIFLLYSGIEANPITLRFHIEGAFIPKNNIEESILLLLLLLNRFVQGRTDWDPSIMDHLAFAVLVSGDLGILARQLEELPADIMDRTEKYSTLALCYHGEGENQVALNLLRNLFNKREKIFSIQDLIFASKICSEETTCFEEGIRYANEAIQKLDDNCQHVASNANCILGILTGLHSRNVASDSQRVVLESRALNLLKSAVLLTEEKDSNVIYHLSLENAEQRKLDNALSYAKKLMMLEAGSGTRGWILLARILSAQKRYRDAEIIVDAGLEQTGKWEHTELLRTKAKIQIARGQTKDAILTYTHLLAVLQVRKRSFGVGKRLLQRKDQDRMLEMETWHDLANVYTSLSQWRDAEVCLSKSEALCPYSASRCHSRGLLLEAKGLNKEAQHSFWEALDKDPNHVPSLLSMAKSLIQLGNRALPLARSLVRQAIHHDRTNHNAWHVIGMIQMLDRGGASIEDAVECFEATVLLEETAPVEPF